MILVGANRNMVAVILAVFASTSLATPALADVLEVGPDGARWIAGGPQQPMSQIEQSASQAPVELARPLVPEQIVGNTQAHAAGIPPEYVAKISELAQRFDLSPALLEAVVWQESRWREGAVSPAGARGLAQLMPGTARDLGVDPDDPMQNLEGGARYLRAQLDRFDGDLEKALAAYNAGPGRVERADGIPNIRETQHYVAAILGRLANHSRPITRPAPVSPINLPVQR
ncbi:lytic transglycosylase domain-containing protein [uncultured Erythrobacter sp.]|uniref:lytic transglycosylase domain-containing protein n=1 Tax=uncultured Erythrobacter sp. TaxID=263913 RepID=UPI00260AC8DF|nr:lytic transglycosylase domain-containing protein [uncultured Erythrobacter sp.]